MNESKMFPFIMMCLGLSIVIYAGIKPPQNWRTQVMFMMVGGAMTLSSMVKLMLMAGSDEDD